METIQVVPGRKIHAIAAGGPIWKNAIGVVIRLSGNGLKNTGPGEEAAAWPEE